MRLSHLLVAAALSPPVFGGPVTLEGQQGPPIVSAGIDFFPYANINNPTVGSFEETVETKILNPHIAVNLPAVFNNGRTAIVNGLSFSALMFDYRGSIPSTVNRPDNLYDVSYRLAVNSRMSDDWSITAFAQPGLASDLENISDEHVRFQGGLIFTRILNQQTRIGFGGVVQNYFGSFLPLPALNVLWIGAGGRVDLQLPRQAGFFVIPSDMIELGLSFKVDGNRFRIGSEQALAEDPIIKYSAITGGPAINLKLTPRAVLNLTGGLTVARRFDVTDQNQVELRSIDLNPGPFVRAGIALRPPAPNR